MRLFWDLLFEVNRNFNPREIPNYWHSCMRHIWKHVPWKRFKPSMTSWGTRYSPIKIISKIWRSHYFAVYRSKSTRLFCIAIISRCYSFPRIRLFVCYKPIFHIFDIINLLMIIFESCCSRILIIGIGIFIEVLLHFSCWSLS